MITMQQLNKRISQIRQVFQGIVSRAGADSLQIKGLSDEVLQDVEVIQHVGFASWIPNDSRVVVVPVGARTSTAVVIGTTGGAVVVTVAEGETCIYDQFGHTIWLKNDGAHINCDLFVAGKIHADGDINSDAQVSDVKGSMQKMRNSYNTHKNGNTPPPDQQME